MLYIIHVIPLLYFYSLGLMAISWFNTKYRNIWCILLYLYCIYKPLNISYWQNSVCKNWHWQTRWNPTWHAWPPSYAPIKDNVRFKNGHPVMIVWDVFCIYDLSMLMLVVVVCIFCFCLFLHNVVMHISPMFNKYLLDENRRSLDILYNCWMRQNNHYIRHISATV